MGIRIVASCLLLLVTTAASPSPAAAPTIDWQVVSRRPHDVLAWTQGLQLDAEGRLFESTGLLGRSSLREVEPQSGEVLRQVALAEDLFGEGLALVDDRLIQLTWTSGRAIAWDAATFEPIDGFEYTGEGWGLCFDGQRLVMSDGSATLTFRDPGSFEIIGRMEIEPLGAVRLRLNELECVDGQVWANLYPSDRIARIDPRAGRVTGLLDLSALVDEQHQAGDANILNGIAYDATSDTYLVTGKLWSEIYEIRLLDGERAGAADDDAAHSRRSGRPRLPGG